MANIVNSVIGMFSNVQKQQNSWNPPSTEINAKQISKEEVFDKLGNQEWSIPRKLFFPVKRDPVIVTSPFGVRYLQGVKQMHIGEVQRRVDRSQCSPELGVSARWTENRPRTVPTGPSGPQ
jgi:hypothetical protein